MPKKGRQHVRTEFSDAPLDGDRGGVHRVRSFHGREGEALPFYQPVIKAFALCGEKIQAVFIAHHHVNGGGYRATLVIHGRHDGGVDVI